MDLSSPIVPRHYDYMGVDKSGSTTDVYTYYIGGASGELQGTVTVTYTTTSKTTIATITRT